MDIIKKSLYLWMKKEKEKIGGKRKKNRKKGVGEETGQAQLMAGKKDVIVQSETGS